MKILVTGGSGYVGSVLVPKWLANGHDVIVYDALYYGQFLPSHPKLTVIDADIRDQAAFSRACNGVNALLHLASISNDPSETLPPSVVESINYTSLDTILTLTQKAGVERFIFASSTSVYGRTTCPLVDEKSPVAPITLYAKTKAACEKIALQHADGDMILTVIRPATVYGYSPRMRFDLIVNRMILEALQTGNICLNSNIMSNIRPTVHIEDLADFYTTVLSAPEPLIRGEIFNLCYQNITLYQIAETIAKTIYEHMGKQIPLSTREGPAIDQRSYSVSAGKARKILGFEQRKDLAIATCQLCDMKSQGLLPENLNADRYNNVTCLQKVFQPEKT